MSIVNCTILVSRLGIVYETHRLCDVSMASSYIIQVKRSEDSKAAVKIYNITKIGKNHQFLRSSHRFQF